MRSIARMWTHAAKEIPRSNREWKKKLRDVK